MVVGGGCLGCRQICRTWPQAPLGETWKEGMWRLPRGKTPPWGKGPTVMWMVVETANSFLTTQWARGAPVRAGAGLKSAYLFSRAVFLFVRVAHAEKVCVCACERARGGGRELVCITFQREFFALRWYHFNRNRITLARVLKQAVSLTRKRLGDTTCLRTTALSMRAEGERRRMVGVKTIMVVTPRKGRGSRGRLLRNRMATVMSMIARTKTRIRHGPAFRYRASPKRRGSVLGGWGKSSLQRFRHRTPCSAARQRG